MLIGTDASIFCAAAAAAAFVGISYGGMLSPVKANNEDFCFC